MSRRLLAAAALSGSLGPTAALGLLVPMEAGIPIPVPSDLLMLFVGERAAGGGIPLWLAVLALEAVTIAGTSALFFAVRGPARNGVRRVADRVGLGAERIDRTTRFLESGGRGAIAVGRSTPGLRTITTVAAALSSIPPARALPALLVGSTVFVQGHLVLGFFLGPLAREALDRARVPALIVAAVLLVAGVVIWRIRKGRSGSQAWAEACCPACLAIGALRRTDPLDAG